jgi:LysM repeat protein
MSEVIADGAEKPIIVEEKKPETNVSDLMKAVADLKASNDELNKKWQSKFDTVLGEKKAVEGKALTVEQRLELVEKERLEERVNWSRKEAKAKAQIDDELDAAILAYSSNDVTKIQEGASLLRASIDKVMAEKIDLAVKAALEKVGSQPAPVGGSKPMPTNTLEALKEKYEQAVKDKNGDAMLYYKEQMAKIKRG